MACRITVIQPGLRNPWLFKISDHLDRPVVADCVRSPMAGFKVSSSENAGLAERPLSGKLDGRNGHAAAVRL